MGKHAILFVTGTDTGVGKTVLTGMLTRALRASGRTVAALKPLCSGTRADARRLREAAGGALSLNEVNPWWFRAPLTPWVAARAEGRRVRMVELVEHVQAVRRRYDWVLVEGAGGLLSPLGEGYDARDLIVQLRARVAIVGWNRLGVLNQVLLTLRALPPGVARDARVVLMTPRRPDASSASNPQVLRERMGADRVEAWPWLSQAEPACAAAVRPELGRLVRWLTEPIGS
jgi:dethiobiotin synthetase